MRTDSRPLKHKIADREPKLDALHAKLTNAVAQLGSGAARRVAAGRTGTHAASGSGPGGVLRYC